MPMELLILTKKKFRPHLPGKSDAEVGLRHGQSPTLTIPPQEHILRHVWQEVQAIV